MDLLVARGLSIPTREDAANFLKRQNYYRFSGYARYFQNAPSNGDPRFKPDAHWDDIVEIYNTDIAVRALLLRGIQAAEIAARAAFALSEGALHSPYEEYLEPTAYKVPKLPSVKATNELIISELRRSKEPYLAKYRRDASDEGREWIYDVPVWAAVEALSLGTLSKAISFRNDGNAVYSRTCSILGTKKQFLTSQLRSFTFVRNKCAHSHGCGTVLYLTNQQLQTACVGERSACLAGSTTAIQCYRSSSLWITFSTEPEFGRVS